MDYNIELHKQLIREEEKQRQEVVYNKWINYVPQSSALVNYNARMIPISLIKSKGSVLLYCYFQKYSNWNKDTEFSFRYCFREYAILTNIEKVFYNKENSRICTRKAISKKFKELIELGYVIDDEKHRVKIPNTYFTKNENTYVLVSETILDYIVSIGDELFTRVFLYYIFAQYINGKDNSILLYDDLLLDNIGYSKSSKNKKRLKEIRDRLQFDRYITVSKFTEEILDNGTGRFKTTNAIRVIKF